MFLIKYTHKPKTMKSLNLMVSILAFVALVAVFAGSASALLNVSIDEVIVNGNGAFGTNETAAVIAGETVPVRIIFEALENATDIRITAHLLGEGVSETSRNFDIFAGGTYSELLNIEVPFDIDLTEIHTLEITVENNEGSVQRDITFRVQRDSDLVEILAVNGPQEIKAGQSLGFDVVLKNRGLHEAEDTFVRMSIAELGVSNTVLFGDLSPEDQSDPDKEDTQERRVSLVIPKSAKPGVYAVELEAYNSESSTVTTKRIVVVGAGEESRVLSPITTKTFAVGEEKTYSMTIVNAGNEIKVYDVLIDAPAELSVSAEDTIVVVPAGSSKTVQFTVTGTEEGNYPFSVNVNSDGEVVKRETFGATIKGTKVANLNASVVLTVVLAIIFVVLVIVLIVLLTRKPQKAEQFGESYY